MKFVDIDGHILEPPDLWVENLEPEYRDRAMQFKKDDEGLGLLGYRREGTREIGQVHVGEPRNYREERGSGEKSISSKSTTLAMTTVGRWPPAPATRPNG